MNTSSAIMLLVLISSFFLMPACATDSDTTPPDILGFDFSPKIINTTASSASIKFTAHLTDDLSGIRSMQANFYSPSDSQSITFFASSSEDRVSGTDLDGIYERSVTLPRYSEQGTWKLRSISLYDRVGNRISLNRADMINLGFPVEFQVTSMEDISPPQILDFDFIPKSLNTTTSSADIKFTARLADDLSGIRSIQANFYSPSDSQSITFFASSSEDRVSGTDLDGIYERSVTLPRYSEQGTWKLRSISLYDRVDNRISLNRADMMNLGFPVEFQVVSREDTTPPEILDFNFSPKTINTNDSSADIKFTAHLADDLSGIRSMQANFYSPSDSQSITFFASSSEDRVSGTDLDGIYERSVTLPRYSEQGTWKLRSISLYDRVDNRISLNRADMMNLGFPVEFEVVSKEDTSPPGILGFDFDPRSLNTTASSGNITFTAHLGIDISTVHGYP